MEFASRGGRARARRYPKETLRAWAAKGGHAKAAKPYCAATKVNGGGSSQGSTTPSSTTP